MKRQKEILVQDVGEGSDVRFKDFHVYRREDIAGEPLYFAPYFIRESKGPEGISYLSKVLGKLDDFSAEDILKDTDKLNKFSSNRDLIEKWIKGVEWEKDKGRKFSYLFLEKQPLCLNSPLKKSDEVKEVETELNNGNIGKNVRISFKDFVLRSIKAHKS